MKIISIIFLITVANCGHVPGREGKCEYINEANSLLGNVYGCKIKSAVLQKDEEKFTVTGTHASKGRRDLGVKFVEFTLSNITHLPEQLFRKFTNLQYLSVNGVGLKRLQLSNASNIKVILANNNQISNLAASSFIAAHHLETLSLRMNLIEEIDLNAFKDLTNLKELYLANNKISMLHINTLNPLINLEILSLSGNQIQSLDLESFQTNLKLREILLYENKLKAIHPQTFGNLRMLFNLELNGNVCIDDNIRADEERFIIKVNRMLAQCYENYPLI